VPAEIGVGAVLADTLADAGVSVAGDVVVRACWRVGLERDDASAVVFASIYECLIVTVVAPISTPK
jgi:hypothetical protein